MMCSAILFLDFGFHAPQNLYIKSTLKALCLLVSEIDVLLWKWPPFCKMAFTMSDRAVWYISQYFFWNLRLTKPIYTVKVEGSAPLCFWDSGHFGKWPPQPPQAIGIWTSVDNYISCAIYLVCPVQHITKTTVTTVVTELSSCQMLKHTHTTRNTPHEQIWPHTTISPARSHHGL